MIIGRHKFLNMKWLPSLVQSVAFLWSFSFFTGSILIINKLATIPGTPISYQPAVLYSNFVFAMELGLSLPYPKVMGPILWLFITWFLYFLARKILDYFFTKGSAS